MERRKFHSLDNMVLDHSIMVDPTRKKMSQDEDSSYASSEEEGNIHITLLERLIRTHPVWFLPSLQRSGAIHLLQGREVGNFIVRSSTQPMTMAVSVKLPTLVEHYLLKAVDNRIALENSTNTFETVHQLIHHYCNESNEIPVCLRVPSPIAEATSRQQLRSLALLGQEFWTRSPTKETSSPSDIEVSRNFISSGLGSQSSSQNSLPDNRPHRPTTLNLNTVPKPPPRWSKSTLLSSVQSTPTESLHTPSIISMSTTTTATKMKKKKKLRSSIHYKDVELFKGKKTSYDDKASDYEDIWSPMNKPKPLSTFKPNNRLSLFESKSIYSEPIDSLRFKRFGAHRHSEPNIRWSHVIIHQDDESSPEQQLNTTSSVGNLWKVEAGTPVVVLGDNELKNNKKNNSRWGFPGEEDGEEQEERTKILQQQGVKFPVLTPPNSPGQRHESYRFSRYDNLEYRKSDDEKFVEENSISQPWDSSKWEHLLKIVSDSTMQLDSISIQNEKNKYRTSASIQAIVRELAEEGNGVFGPTLKSFITCTLAVKAKDPHKIMRNTRQFMNGMKNYLTGTTSAETEKLRQEIKKQTEQLDESEFLNIDSILEEVLVDLILRPLYAYIMDLLNSTNTDLTLATRDEKNRPDFHNTYDRFREAYSPLVKLEKWSEFVTKVQIDDTYNAENSMENLSRALSSVCTKDIKSHVDYTLTLLPHSALEANNYVLTLLQSVIEHLQSNIVTSVKVVIPDERNGTLIRKIVPVQSSTTNKEVIKMVATKLGISNTGDYVLVKIKNGEEKICPDAACVELGGQQTALAFKRLDAKIGWPAKI